MNKNILSSALATGIAELVTLPICNVKTNFQNSNQDIRSVVSTIFKNDGIKGFYRASLPAILSQVISTSSKYTLYQYFGDNFNTPKILNGLVSGILSSLVTHPLDFLKIHLQMKTKPDLKLVYRGYSKSFGKIVIGSVLFFPLYDLIKERTGDPFSASFFSAMVSTVAMQPLDYLKVRHIYNQSFNHGWRVKKYYKGITLNLFRVVPHFMIVMVLTERFKKL